MFFQVASPIILLTLFVLENWMPPTPISLAQSPYPGMDPADILRMIADIEWKIQRRSEEAQILEKLIICLATMTHDNPRPRSYRIINGRLHIRPMMEERLEMRCKSYYATLEALEGLKGQLEDLKMKSQRFPRWR